MEIKTTNILLNGELQAYYIKKAIDVFKKNTFFYDMGNQEFKPSGMNSVIWSLIVPISGGFNEATEGVTPAGDQFQMEQVEGTFKQYIKTVILTDLVLSDDYTGSTWENAVTELVRFFAEEVDKKIQSETLELGTNPNNFYAGNATSRVTIDTSDILAPKDLSKARAKLAGAAVPTYDGDYVAIIHPDVVHDIITASTFTAVKQYGEPTSLFNGEIGKIYGVRVIEGNNIRVFTGEGAGGIDVYPTYVFGKDAYGVAKSDQDMTIIMKGLGSGGAEDAADQRGSVAIKCRYSSKLLKEESLIRVESASSI